MKRIGLVVNPVAGLGGPAGMKGSDRPEALSKARELGIEPKSLQRATDVFRKVKQEFEGNAEFFAAPGGMGADALEQAGFQVQTVGSVSENTTAADTERIAKELVACGIDLLIFAGGDGTARDVLRAVGQDVLTFGIPTGVKMHSSVFAVHPTAAAQLILRFLSGRVMGSRFEDVVDLDESAYVAGRIETKLYGAMKVPTAPGLLQGMKAGRSASETESLGAIGQQISEMIRQDTQALYAIGAGTSTAAVKQMLDTSSSEFSLLGVDVYSGSQCILRDANANELKELAKNNSLKIVISPIGGQGYLFGRGNQQFTPETLSLVGRDNITVICPPGKLSSLRQKPFLVDTGDEALDSQLRGYIRVHVGFNQEIVYKIV